MKKTLISTLITFGLTVSASATTIETWDAETLLTSGGSLAMPEGYTLTNYGLFSLTAILDTDTVKTALTGNHWKRFLWVNCYTNANYQMNLSLNGSSSGTSDGIYGGSGQGTGVGALNFGSPIGTIFGQTYSSGGNFEAIAVTMLMGNTGLNCYLTLIGEDGVITEYSGTALTAQKFGTSNWTGLGYDVDVVKYLAFDNTYLSATDALAANRAALEAYMAPEPATASLTLLGLAALAMRRRRA